MPMDTFKNIHYLPDSVPGTDGHYSPFSDVLGTQMTEEHRPSLQSKKAIRKSLPFTASVQHVKNIDIMVMCEECHKWRLLYSKCKLNKAQREAQIQDLLLGDCPAYARNISYYDPTEKLYYSVGTYPPICTYCGAEEGLKDKERCYPQCTACEDREKRK